MRLLLRLLAPAGVASTLVVATAPPAAAHGLGGRSDLPLPLWLFAYGAGFALLISFVALRLLWPAARLQAAAAGRRVPEPFDRAVAALGLPLRLVGLAAFGITLWAAWFGAPSAGSNIAPVAVYVVFWVGLPVVSAVVDDVWRVLSPFDSLAAAWQRIGRRRAHDERPPATPHWASGHWLAAAVLLAFQWLELAYHSPASTKVLALALSLYSVAMLAGAARWGRAWLRTGEGFGVLFGLIAHLAPFHRDDDGKLRVRPPFSGLAELQPRPGTAAAVLVVLGGTTFDGVTRTSFWTGVVGDANGWALTAYNTVGLVWVVGVVAVAYVAAMRLAARLSDRPPEDLVLTFVHSLVPIVVAYTIAHYFSLFVFEGQGALALASDPFGRGWNLFGTADRVIDFRTVSVAAIAYVQAGAIVVGHVAGVVVAHDRAVELFPLHEAVRSQYPVLAAMVLYTVGGLTLLLGA